MPTRKGVGTSGRRFATPALLILGLLAIHWLVSAWPAIPRLISATFAAMS